MSTDSIIAHYRIETCLPLEQVKTFIPAHSSRGHRDGLLTDLSSVFSKSLR